jgi:hypothetical protein
MVKINSILVGSGAQGVLLIVDSKHDTVQADKKNRPDNIPQENLGTPKNKAWNLFKVAMICLTPLPVLVIAWVNNLWEQRRLALDCCSKSEERAVSRLAKSIKLKARTFALNMMRSSQRLIPFATEK